MYYRHWNADMIRRHILTRRKPESLNMLYYSQAYPEVYAAAQRLFGSWKNALEDCGFDYSKIRKYRKWSQKRVIEKIRKLAKEKHSLSSNIMQKIEKPLYMAAVRKFGSWGKAVTAAGLDYEKIRVRKKRTPDNIHREIKILIRQSEDLSYSNMRKNYPALLGAAMKKIGNGSWIETLKQCKVI